MEASSILHGEHMPGTDIAFESSGVGVGEMLAIFRKKLQSILDLFAKRRGLLEQLTQEMQPKPADWDSVSEALGKGGSVQADDKRMGTFLDVITEKLDESLERLLAELPGSIQSSSSSADQELQAAKTKIVSLERVAKEAKLLYEQEKNKAQEQEQMIKLVQQAVQRQEEDISSQRNDLSNLRLQISHTNKEVQLWMDKCEKLQAMNSRSTALTVSQRSALEQQTTKKKELERVVSEQQQTICCVEAEVQRFSRLNSGLSSELQECKLFLSKCEDDVKALTSERQKLTFLITELEEVNEFGRKRKKCQSRGSSPASFSPAKKMAGAPGEDLLDSSEGNSDQNNFAQGAAGVSDGAASAQGFQGADVAVVVEALLLSVVGMVCDHTITDHFVSGSLPEGGM